MIESTTIPANNILLQLAKNRLRSFNYQLQETDNFTLAFAAQKVENTIKNECNLSAVPEGLLNIAADMAVGEFLAAKKTFSPESISSLDLDTAVKQIQTGDTSTTFAVENSSSPEQRFDTLVNHLLTYGRSEFSCYRKLRW